MEEIIIDPSLNVPIPHFCKNPTAFTVSDGNWSDPNVWSNGVIPTDNDIVNVLHNIIYDVTSDHVLKGICVEDFGSLIINEGITKLIAQNFMVMHEGMLTIQCVKEESLCELIIADLPLDLINDPYQYGNGLLVFGIIQINGMWRTPYGRVISEPIKGDSTLGLEIPEDWKIKDEIFIADTQAVLVSPPLPDRTEFRIINDRLDHLIGIDPLTFDHKGWRDKEGVLDPICLPHVANITRNVIIRSANPNNRGHVLFMHDAHVDIQGTRFRDLGRTTTAPLNNTKVVGSIFVVGTNQIGKYACHFHHVKNVCRFVDNVIEKSTKWGLTIHNTHFSIFQHNTIIDASGAGIMLEAGNETDNDIGFNFICKIGGIGGRGDQRNNEFGFEGTGIWSRGINSYIHDNIVASVKAPTLAGFGYKLFQQYLGSPGNSIKIPTEPNQDPKDYITVNPYKLPIKQFDRNECYGCGQAMTYWWIGTKNNNYEFEVGLSVVNDLFGWNVRAGITHYPAYNLSIVNPRLRGVSSTSGGAAIYCGDYLAGKFSVIGGDAQGFQLGVQPSTITVDEQRFINLLLRNVTNYRFDLLWTSSSSGIGINKRRILIDSPVNKRWGAGYDYSTYYTPNQVCNLVEKNEVFVNNDNGNFEILFIQQKFDFIMPTTTYNPNGSIRIVGCPEAGLTNQQAFDKYDIALNGKIARDYTTRPNVLGLVRMI